MTTYGAALKPLWPLDPAVTYLNHGGYGVTPHEVAAVYADWHARIERNPTRFMAAEYPRAIREAAAVLARFVGAAADDLVFIDNATSGCNAVLHSLNFKPGDEILVTDLTYGAIVKAARYVADRTGARVVTATVPLPMKSDGDLFVALRPHFTGRTRLVIIDHIVSPVGLVLPVRHLSDVVHEMGVRVLVDGAHVPGNLPLNVVETGADWYVANCHKWLFAPRACGFLWASGVPREMVRPLSMSHGYGQGMVAEFDWTGTRDPSAFLSVPAGIAFYERMGGTELMTRNADMVYRAAQRLAARWNTDIAGPHEMCTAMAAVRLPPGLVSSASDAVALRGWLSSERNIEVALGYYGDAGWLRIAAQAYNDDGEYDRLIDALASYPGRA